MSPSITALVDAFLEARMTNDPDQCEAFLAPDLLYELIDSNSGNVLITTRGAGHKAIDIFKTMVNLWEIRALTIGTSIVNENRLDITFQTEFFYKPIKKSLTIGTKEVFVANGGKIIEIRQYFDASQVSDIIKFQSL